MDALATPEPATTHATSASRHALRRRTTGWLIERAFKKAVETSAPAPLPRHGIHRILVSRMSHTLGNTLLVTPLLRELSRIYPGAEIDIVTRSPVARDVFGSFERVHTIYSLPRRSVASPQRLASVMHALRTHRYDLAIDPGVVSRSDRICVLAANATWKIGYASGKTGTLTHAVPAPASLRHVAQLPVHLLRAAIGDHTDDPYPTLDIRLSHEERARGRRLLHEICGCDAPILGLFTAATGTKQIDAAWWQAFATQHRRVHPDVRVVEVIPLASASRLGDRFPTFFSSDLRKLASVLAGFTRFASGDCGVMHLACASGVATTGLFQGTNIAEWGPYGTHDAALDITASRAEDVAASFAYEAPAAAVFA